MRNIDDQVMELLSNGEKFVYCFEISKGPHRILLTSNDLEIKIEGKKYLPFSGLKVKEMIFNESAQDFIEITGVFEKFGVKESDDLTDYMFMIDLYFPGKFSKFRFAEHICTRMKRYGLRFRLYLSSISIKFGSSVLETYSSSCRAIFGDSKCGIDKTRYQEGTSCDKKFITCCNKFNNAINFRGEPFIPVGNDV